MTDGEIKRTIEAAFLLDPRLSSFNTKIEVTNGVVTITGVVANLKG